MEKKKNILIVDDETSALETLTDVLKDAGYEVSTALNGTSALECISRAKFNLIILDIILPDMNGIDLLRMIKQKTPGIEVIIITGHASIENSIKAINEGAYAYIKKPFNPDEVKSVVGKAIEKQNIILEKDHLLKDLQKTVVELQQSRDELIQAEKLSFAGRMAASVAHEIRNPLNIIGMSVQQLREELPKKDSRREYTVSALKNIDRVDKLITDFTSIAKPSKLKMKLKDINAVIEDAIKLMEPKVIKLKAKVIKDLAPDLPKIGLDEQRISQAFTNMLLNAFDAMPKKGGKIWITSVRDDKFIIIKIRNRGRPIPKKDIIRIFDPFFSGKRKGTGLGLSIVYTIIGSHGGTIGVESDKRIGTVFIVKLPL